MSLRSELNRLLYELRHFHPRYSQFTFYQSRSRLGVIQSYLQGIWKVTTKVKIIDLICFIPLRRLRCYDCAEIPYQSSSKTVHGDIEKSCFSLRDPSCHDIPYDLRCHVDQNRVLKINVTCFQRIFVALGYLAFHAISSNLAV